MYKTVNGKIIHLTECRIYVDLLAVTAVLGINAVACSIITWSLRWTIVCN